MVRSKLRITVASGDRPHHNIDSGGIQFFCNRKLSLNNAQRIPGRFLPYEPQHRLKTAKIHVNACYRKRDYGQPITPLRFSFLSVRRSESNRHGREDHWILSASNYMNLHIKNNPRQRENEKAAPYTNYRKTSNPMPPSLIYWALRVKARLELESKWAYNPTAVPLTGSSFDLT